MKNRLQLFFGLLIIIAFFVWINAFSLASTTDNNLHIYFLNVGQGDAAYIKNPDGSDILIDGGPDDTVLAELGRVMTLGDRRIDLIILTHPHADHLTGLIDVINRFEIGEVWETGVEYSSATYDEWKLQIKEKGISGKFVDVNSQKQFGEVKFFVLSPLSNLENQKIDNVNNASIVSRLEYNQFSTLFMGDAEEAEQKSILGNLQKATVLKAGHHGSRNGTTESLLSIVRPAVAIISSGESNTYGHPHAETINLLKRFAVQIYRTDQNKTIDISSDGDQWLVKTGI